MISFKYYNFIILSLICHANAEHSEQDSNNKNGVIIYSEENQKGYSTFLKEGFYSINELPQDIKSFKIISDKPNVLDNISNISDKNNISNESTASNNTSENNTSSTSDKPSDNIQNNKTQEQYELIISDSDNLDDNDDKKQYPLFEDIIKKDIMSNNDVSKVNNNYSESNNEKDIYTIDNVSAPQNGYIYVYKVNLDNKNGINYQDEYDENTGKYLGNNIKEMKEIKDKDKLKDITIYYSPEFKGLPDLTQYKNLKSIKLLGNTFNGKDKKFIENEYKKIVNYINKVHIINVIELSKGLPPYSEYTDKKFFGFSLENLPNLSNDIQEIHLINCSNLSVNDFINKIKDCKNLRKICMYGNTFESANNYQWNDIIKQIFYLSLNTFREESTGIWPFKSTKQVEVNALLSYIQLPRTFTGEIPKIGEPKLSQIVYFSALGATSVAQDAFIDSQKLTEINLPKVKMIKQGVFHNNKSLKIVNIPEVEEIITLAFEDCPSLTKVGDVDNILNNNGMFIPKVKLIGAAAFRNGEKVQNIIIESMNLPLCERIENEAFMRFRKLKKLSVPQCKFIGTLAFYDPYALQAIDLSNVETIGERAFQFASVPMTSFKTINGKEESYDHLEFPKLIKMENQAFAGDNPHHMTTKSINLPVGKDISSTAFQGCSIGYINAPQSNNKISV